jgi:hypothetical protein
MIDASALQMLLMVLTGWLERREREALAYLIEENRVLRRQLGGRRLRLGGLRVYGVREFAELSGVTVKALRHYERLTRRSS